MNPTCSTPKSSRVRLGLPYALFWAAPPWPSAARRTRRRRPPSPLPAPAAEAEKPFTVGFIYVGPKDDWGYNQAHAEGAAAVAKLPGVKVREEENVPETVAVQKTMESMIGLDGAALVFPTSFGYFDPHILKVADRFNKTPLLHCGGLYVEGKHPGQRGQLLRLHRRGPVRGRHRRRPDHQEEQAGLHRRQAHPPGAAQHQLLHPGRPLGEPQGRPPRWCSPATGRCR